MARRMISLGFVLACSFVCTHGAYAQYVDLGILNIRQQMGNWCWAAAAQQVIAWKMGGAPHQCEMVAVANGAHPAFCCNGNPQCDVPGSMQQIQALVSYYGFSPSVIGYPSDPMTLFQKLNLGIVVIMFVRNSPYAPIGHFVVIRGMDWSGGSAMVFVNDPMNWGVFAQPVPYWELAQYWQAAIEVH